MTNTSAKARSKKKPVGKTRAKKKSATPAGKKWSAKVMKKSDALDLQSGVFKLRSARAIASSLKKSAEASTRRKASPFQSAMSMLNFEINRAGKNLSAERLGILNRAKSELRKVFDRPESVR